MFKDENLFMLTNQMKKAVISAAGFGIRLFPVTKVVKKNFSRLLTKMAELNL